MTQITIPIGSNNIQVDISSSIRNQFKSTFFNKSNNSITCFPKVNDVCRYIIQKNNTGIVLKDCESIKANRLKNSKYPDKNICLCKTKTIVLLLESPHEKEFDSNYSPKAPAQGTTGEKIKNNIIDLLELIDKKVNFFLLKKNYRLILSNPVQYQTSLNFFHGKSLKKDKNEKPQNKYGKLRNTIWKTIWCDKNIQKDFKQRMNNYYPDLIINACTRELQDFITCFLNINCTNSILINTYHPSAPKWNKNNKFGIK